MFQTGVECVWSGDGAKTPRAGQTRNKKTPSGLCLSPEPGAISSLAAEFDLSAVLVPLLVWLGQEHPALSSLGKGKMPLAWLSQGSVL